MDKELRKEFVRMLEQERGTPIGWAIIVKNGKGKKITVFKYKPKKNEKKKMGHRQPYTKVEIVKIAL